jgi:hypothetical protein
LALAASQQRMKELGISTGVVRAIDDELAGAIAALEPFTQLAPVALMLQLVGILKTQVAALQTTIAPK